MSKRKYTIYFMNTSGAMARTGYTYYITTSEERAIELFYMNYSNDYEILRVSEE